jgi:hypothetical protein
MQPAITQGDGSGSKPKAADPNFIGYTYKNIEAVTPMPPMPAQPGAVQDVEPGRVRAKRSA